MLACLILALKLPLLQRMWSLPTFFLYLMASCVTTSCYLLREDSMRVAWDSPIAILGALAALEAGDYMLLGHDEDERVNAYRWALLLGGIFCLIAWTQTPPPYPGYPPAIYFTRLYLGMFSIGWLTGMLRYSIGEQAGLRFFAIHAGILWVRIGADTLPLLEHSRDPVVWFAADNAAKLVSAGTLIAWIWLSLRRATV